MEKIVIKIMMKTEVMIMMTTIIMRMMIQMSLKITQMRKIRQTMTQKMEKTKKMQKIEMTPENMALLPMSEMDEMHEENRMKILNLSHLTQINVYEEGMNDMPAETG